MVTCNNGGTCSDGNCKCPTGYSGLFCDIKAKTAIQYRNNTFTPIAIAVNGDAKVIPVGGTATFIGELGTVAAGNASTSGAASSLGISDAGGIIGLTINWSLNSTFPDSDTLRVPLDVGSTYFFLKMANTGTHDFINYYVNAAFPYGEFYQDITVPHTGITYDMGYYLAFTSSNVQVQTSDSKVIWKAVTLPGTSNQVFTAIF